MSPLVLSNGVKSIPHIHSLKVMQFPRGVILLLTTETVIDHV